MNEIEQQEKIHHPDLPFVGVTKDICIQISEWKGIKKIDLRRWWRAPNDTWARSKNGLNVTLEEWNELIEKIGIMDKFVQDHLG